MFDFDWKVFYCMELLHKRIEENYISYACFLLLLFGYVFFIEGIYPDQLVYPVYGSLVYGSLGYNFKYIDLGKIQTVI